MIRTHLFAGFIIIAVTGCQNSEPQTLETSTSSESGKKGKAGDDDSATMLGQSVRPTVTSFKQPPRPSNVRSFSSFGLTEGEATTVDPAATTTTTSESATAGTAAPTDNTQWHANPNGGYQRYNEGAWETTGGDPSKGQTTIARWDETTGSDGKTTYNPTGWGSLITNEKGEQTIYSQPTKEGAYDHSTGKWNDSYDWKSVPASTDASTNGWNRNTTVLGPDGKPQWYHLENQSVDGNTRTNTYGVAQNGWATQSQYNPENGWGPQMVVNRDIKAGTNQISYTAHNYGGTDSNAASNGNQEQINQFVSGLPQGGNGGAANGGGVNANMSSLMSFLGSLTTD